MVETVGEDEEFEFYLKFAKPLVLNLPDTNDRIKAAAWIRYLKADQTDLALRGEYLKLLLFVLQRRKLYGPFSSIPNEGEPLPTFPDDINIQDVAKNFIEIDKKILQATLEKGGYGEWPPFNVAFSSDLTEYATSQEIPGFGVHAYCAFSRDPLPSWNHVERAIFPIGETIDFAKADSPLVDTGSPDISCFISPDKPEPPPPPESPRRSPRIPPGGLSETTPPSDVAPKAPGKSPFKEDEYGMDERVPPIWGSNLVEVKELELDMTPSPVKDLDIDVSEQDMLDFFNDDLDLFEADMDEATSYLQGDFFSPGGRGGPGGPPGSRGVPGSPARPGSPRTPGGPGPSGGLPSTPCPSSQGPCPASDLSGAGQLALVPSQTPPQFVSQLPEGYFTSPHKMFDLLDDLASDRDMLDYYYPSSPRLPEDDPAFFLQGSRLESPEMLAIEAGPSTSRPLSPREEVKRLERQLIPDDESRRVEREATGLPLPPSPARPRTPTAPCAPLLPPSPARSASPSPPCAVVEEGLGGDSFIARDRRDYRWMADTSPGPGIPTDERQDPALWESFGWWTEDPDEIFQYMSPSPRGRGAADEDPFAEEKKRWGDAVRTPPIFSRDPKIREGPAARRQYTPDEFGMESFEEPVWTSAEQYLKYTRDFSPFRDPRDVERKAYDPADYPNIEIPEMDRRLSEIHGAPEEIAFFEDELSPILMDVTLGDTDLQPLTRVEAMMEAIHHGPQFIGVPTPSPEKTPKTPKEDSGEWEDMRFIEETPPLFMLEPPFLATPPEYEPNPQIEVDELDEDTVRKYIEEDIKLINALVPVTTPQRAPSPKRPPPMTAESPPFVPDIDVEPGPYMPSPELVTPERHIVPPQRTFDWDTNIGTPIKLPETNAVVIVSEQDLLAQNIKRKQELAVIYERQFASPPRIPSPPPMPHLMDAPISSRLPAAMTPEKLPPPGWSWQTPERFQPRPYVPQQTRTPTGISPPIPVPREVTMFYESPPEDLYAADFDMDFDLLSPPTPSPPRQPQPPTQMAPMSYWQKDIIERELQEPSAFDLEDVDLPDMPDFPITPERAVSTPIVQEFIKSDIRDLMPELFVTSPQAAAQHEVVVPPPKPPSKLSKGKMKAASGSKLQTPSGRQLKTPSGSRLKTPSGSKIQAPCAGKRKATSASKLPAPGTSKLPAPGTSKLQAPSGSKLQPPCASRIAKRGPPSKLKIPGAKIPKPAPQIPKEEVDELAQEILDLEAELFPDVPRDVRPRRPPPTLPPPEFSPPTPEHQRRLWRQQLEMHDYKPYPKKSFVVQPKPGKSRRVAKYSHRPQLPGIPDSLTSPPPSMSRPVGSPTAQISPERAAWREQVRQHQATPFRRKIFHVRPKHGKAIALRGARRPDLETVADTSPVDAEDLDAAIRELEDEVYKPRSPVGVPDVPSGVTVEQLNEEIMRLEQELALLSTPPRQAPCPGDSPETPPHFREWWKEAIQEGEMEAYPKPRKHYKPPSLETILSPRHPDFAPRQQDRYVQDVRRQAARAVEYDKSLLTQEQERDLYQLPRQHRERAEYQMSDAERAYWQTRRIDIQVPSPPQRPVTPPSLLDEELPEGLPPCLMPPSGWDWRTPERFKQKPYVPHETRTPTGISPPRPVPPELTMFHESPPEDLYDLDMAMLSPPDFSPRTPSPPRAPPQPISIPSTSSQIVPATYWQKDIIEREMQWPGEIEALDDMQIPDIPDMPDISPLRPAAPAAICPAAAAAAAASPTAAVCGGRTSPKLTEESQALRAEMARKRKDFRPQREFRVKRGSRMAPLPRARPPSLPTIPGSPPGPCGQREQLGREIKDLYERSQLSTPLRRRGGPPPYDPDSPPTPDFARRAYRHWTATHQMVPYDEPRQQLYTPPTLPTILSPGHPEFAERQRQEPVRALERHAQRRVERDIRDIREQQRKKVFKPSKRRTKPKCPCITVTGPTPSPEPVVTPEPPPHLLDEPVPEGQPQALLPPSGWIWKTPERYQPQPYVPKEKPVPTGLSPPRQIPKELTMFHESPPEDLYSPGSPEYDELNLAMLSPPDMSPRAPCPCKTPEGQMVPLGYWQRDAIDRELQEPTDLDDVEMPAIADYEMSPEEPRMITPERAAWRSSVQEHTTVPLRRKIFHVRPRPGRAVALRGAKRPGLATVEDSSPPEPPMAVEGVPEGITVDQLNREIEELEAELEMLRTPPRPKTPPPGDGSPPTPEIERRMWREMVRLHEPLPYTKTVTYSQPPELETIFSQSHPSQAAIARERHIADMRRQAARSCAVDIDRITAEKQKDLYPLPEQHQERVQYEMSDAEREYWRTRRYDVDVPSPPSPAPIPGPPMHLLDEPVPEDLPKGLIRPCGWTYQTPPQMKYRTPEERRTKTPTGIPSPTLPKLPPPGTLFYESPPLISSPESDSPQSLTPSPCAVRSPISPNIPSPPANLDVAMYYPPEYDELDTEPPPELYSSPEFDEPDYDDEIRDLEAEVFGPGPCGARPRRPPRIPPPQEVSPPTPDYQRKVWRQELEMRDYEPYPKRSFTVKPKPGKSVRVAKYSHRPRLGAVAEPVEPVPSTSSARMAPVEDPLDAEIRALEGEVFAPCAARTLPIRPQPTEVSPPTPQHQRRIWRQSLDMHEYTPYTKKSFSVKPKPGKSCRVAKYSHRPKMEAVTEKYYEVSPVSPPLRPRPLQDVSIPMPEVTVPPENWTWKTPSPLNQRGIYAESPPLVYSPPSPSAHMPQAGPISPLRPTTPTPCSMFRRPAPPSPLRSPGGRPVMQGLQDRPLDAFERAQAVPQDFDVIDLISPDVIDLTSPDYIDLTTPPRLSPPAPPPRPCTPQAFMPPPRRIPGRRPLDPNVLYAGTPLSAMTAYEQLPETIRFESERPIALQPTTPEPPTGYYETPVPPATRPWRKQRKRICKKSARRLQFEDAEPEEEEDENVRILQLQAQLMAQSPPRDVMMESPPDMSPEVEWLGDLVYEPPVFNLYSDEDAPDYNVRPAFEGQPDVDLMDTSPIETIERIPMHLRDFRWMDSPSCGSRCPGKR